MFQTVRYANLLICIFMNIYENIKKQRKNAEKLRDIPTKYPISQLLIQEQVKSWSKKMLRQCSFIR